MRSRPSSTTAPRATICAMGSKPFPIWRARWRASSSAAADRAILPRSATGFSPRGEFRQAAFGARRRAARSRRRRSQACAGPMPPSPTSLRTSAGRRVAGVPPRRRFRPRRLRAALDEARALRDESRRVIAALQVRYAETTGVRVAENPAQQCARLFRRRHRAARRKADDARRSTQPSSIARPPPGRCASPPPSSASSKQRSPMPPIARWRWNLKYSTALAASVTAATAAIKQAAEALAVVDVATALAALAVERDYVRPDVDGTSGVCDQRRPPSGGRAGARHRRRPVRRQRLRLCRRQPTPEPAASGWSPARTWRANRRSCARTR